ncbi:MAG TPA: hypothetical protein VF582_00830 [Allosphingosinicella sp.]|jgi:hypothetical protein
MRNEIEYEYILPDGSCRYEIIDLTVPARPQMFALKRMHGAVLAWPVSRGEAMPQYRQRLIRRLEREHQARARPAAKVESP